MTYTNASDFQGRLMSGERLLWSGRPEQGLTFSASDGVLIPFSLVWGGFSIFWLVQVVTMKAPAAFVVFGVPFVVIGLFLIFGRFFVDAWLRARTFYAVTDRRVLILRSGPYGDFRALQLDRLPEAGLRERADGGGTIIFGQLVSAMSGGRGGGWAVWVNALNPTPQFIGIENVRSVYDLIQKQMDQVER